MSEYDVYWLCECSAYGRIPFDNWAHVHASVCHGCGAPLPGKTISRVVGREVGWWNPRLEVLLPAPSETPREGQDG